jgi:hypothetical protein
MSNTKAYTVLLGPHQRNKSNVPVEEGGSTLGPTIGLINQTSPAWVLTFVRWQYRDTLRTPTDSPNAVRRTLVVENDCLQVTISDNKSTLTPNMTALLVETDVNYAVEVHPGDFVFVNLLNWETDARNVANAARAGTQINGINQGFKGFFKVQSVRKVVSSNPETGTRTVLYKIDGFAFTEFNNTIYFNPNLINQKSLQNQALFLNDISAAWASLVNNSGKPAIQDVLAFLIQSLIGSGVNPQAQTVGGLTVSQNTHFLVPALVGNLLGINSGSSGLNYTSTIAAKDIYNYLFGIQQYSAGQFQTESSGLNPSNLQSTQVYPNFYYTNQFCPGYSLLKPEYWNQVKLWSILNQYTNSPLNELYTCFRVAPNGAVMPTVVFRQIPFTSEDFVGQTFGTQDQNASTIPATRFLTVPRWKIGGESVYSIDIGTDEAARVNFVQYYARSNFSEKGMEMANETALVNYSFDANDITRSGLRPYVVQNQFDDLPDRLTFSAPVWARICADALIGGHLRLNGTIECVGITQPIAIGDNLEFDGVVYHIEQISHTASINPQSGMKSFRTSISVSHGVSIHSSSAGTEYSQMTYADGYQDRQHDYKHQQILPGVSESQDTIYRPASVDGPHGTGAPFPQPTLVSNQKKFGE